MALRRSALYDDGLAGRCGDPAGRSRVLPATSRQDVRVAGRGLRKKNLRLKSFDKSARGCQRKLGNVLRLRKAPKARSAADFAFVRAVSKRGRRPGDEVWGIFRRSASDPTDIKYYLSNAPARIAKTDLARQAGLRSPSRDCDRRRQKRTGDGSLRDPHVAGLASPYDADLPGASFSGASSVEDEKKLRH